VLLSYCDSASNVSPRIQTYRDQRKSPSRHGIDLTITCGIHVLPLQMDPVGNLALFACHLEALYALGVFAYAKIVN
jgi:hypothetical protein